VLVFAFLGAGGLGYAYLTAASFLGYFGCLGTAPTGFVGSIVLVFVATVLQSLPVPVYLFNLATAALF
jgi:hypothetical protein